MYGAVTLPHDVLQIALGGGGADDDVQLAGVEEHRQAREQQRELVLQQYYAAPQQRAVSAKLSVLVAVSRPSNSPLRALACVAT